MSLHRRTPARRVADSGGGARLSSQGINPRKRVTDHPPPLIAARPGPSHLGHPGAGLWQDPARRLAHTPDPPVFIERS